MKQNHTPTPWEAVDKGHEGFMIQSPSAHYSSCNIAHYVGKNDAAFIVRAVNLHEKLIEAVEIGLGDILYFAAENRQFDRFKETIAQMSAVVKEARGFSE